LKLYDRSPADKCLLPILFGVIYDRYLVVLTGKYLLLVSSMLIKMFPQHPMSTHSKFRACTQYVFIIPRVGFTQSCHLTSCGFSLESDISTLHTKSFAGGLYMSGTLCIPSKPDATFKLDPRLADMAGSHLPHLNLNILMVNPLFHRFHCNHPPIPRSLSLCRRLCLHRLCHL
jgi:hypothetical protein